MGEIKEKTISGVKWSAIEKFSVQGVVFIVGLVMARLLTPADFGIVGMLSIFMAISQTFIDSGFSNALIRKIDRTEVDCSTAFFFNVVVGLICYGLLFLFSPFIADFYNMPILSDLTKVLAITLFLNSLTVVQVALLTVKVDFQTQAKVNLTSSFISGVIGVVLAYAGWGVWSLVYQQVSRSALNVILYWIVAKWIPSAVFSWNSFKELFSYGSKLLLSHLLHTFYMNVTNLVIGKLYSPRDLGFYERGQHIGKLPMETTVSIIQRVTFPILATIQDDDKYLISIYRKYIKVASVIVFFCLFLLCALAKPVIEILLSEKWLDSTIYLQFFCFTFMFAHVTRTNLNLLQVKGRSDLFLRLEVIKKALSFFMLLVAAPFGIIPICISQVIYSYLAIYINTYYTDKLFGFSLWLQIKDFSKYFVAAFLSCIPAYFLVLVGLNNILCIALGSIVALFLYTHIFLRKDIIYLELREMMYAYLKIK